MNEDRLQFRAEENVGTVMRDVQRFDTQPVAAENQAAPRFRPHGKSKHAAQPGKAFQVPFEERMQDNLRVAAGLETVSAIFQFLAKFTVIVDLAVENDDGVAIFGRDRLIACGEIDDLESSRSQRDGVRLKNSLLVRPPMQKSGRGPADAIRLRHPIGLRKTRYPAQSWYYSLATSGTNHCFRSAQF